MCGCCSLLKLFCSYFVCQCCLLFIADFPFLTLSAPLFSVNWALWLRCWSLWHIHYIRHWEEKRNQTNGLNWESLNDFFFWKNGFLKLKYSLRQIVFFELDRHFVESINEGERLLKRAQNEPIKLKWIYQIHTWADANASNKRCFVKMNILFIPLKCQCVAIKVA